MDEVRDTALCYLGAERVDSPAGKLAGFDIRSSDDKKLGTIDGVLIDPEARCVRFFVVSSHALMRRHRYTVRADVPTQVDRARHALMIQAPAEQLPRERFSLESAQVLSPAELEPAFSQDAA